MSVFEEKPDQATNQPPAADSGNPPDQGGAPPAAAFRVGDREYTAEDAAKKIVHADEHIKRLEQEADENRRKLDEMMDKVYQLTKQSNPADHAAPPAEPADAGAPSVEELVKQELEKTRMQEAAALNQAKVNDALASRFGGVDEAREALKAKAAELGLSLEDVRQMASKSPSAVLNWFPASPDAPRATTGSTNTQAFGSGSGGSAKEGTYAWWQKLRQEDPKAYFSPKMAHQRIQDAMRLGDKFYN